MHHCHFFQKLLKTCINVFSLNGFQSIIQEIHENSMKMCRYCNGLSSDILNNFLNIVYFIVVREKAAKLFEKCVRNSKNFLPWE